MATKGLLQALRDIQERNRERKLQPEDVIDAARNPRSPLHSRFDWEDSTAAHQWRLQQARQLIASVRISFDAPKEQMAPAFVSLKPDRYGGGGYRSLRDVLNNKALRAELLKTAIEELQAFQERYGTFKELAAVFDAIKRTQKRVNGKVKA